MANELLLRRKWTFRAHGNQVVFVKKSREHATHVLMKAYLWALYLPDYPDLSVEIHISDRYRPDVVQLDPLARPIFWGEAGKVSQQKIRSLLKRYANTHFAIAKWASSLDPVTGVVSRTVARLRRDAPVDLISFPEDSADRFMDQRGNIKVDRKEITFVRVG